MAKQRTEKSPFRSRFAGDENLFITASQFLAENFCDRLARKKQTSLPIRFWETSQVWKREFLRQKRFADGLLKIYSIEAIVRALRTPAGKKIYSLGVKFLDPLIQEEQAKLERQQVKQEEACPEPTPVPTVVEQPRPAFIENKSPLSKLRDL